MTIDDEFAHCDPSELKTRAPFSTLFPMRADLRKRIADSMRERGFDPSKPINVWRQENTVVDGHTRRQAAIDASVEAVVCFHDFKDEDEAMDYAIANQRDRRNLTEAEYLSLVAAVDKRSKAGRPPERELASRDANSHQSRSARDTAAKIGGSTTKVERARRVIQHAIDTGDTEEKDAVLRGDISINQAAQRVRAKAGSKVEAAMAWIDEHGNMPIDKMIAESGFSRGTLDKARQKMGKRTSNPQKRKERDRKAYASVNLSNGNGSTISLASVTAQTEAYDEAWLESLPIRNRVGDRKAFDADALIVRECGPILQEIKRRIEGLIGLRSVAGMSPIQRALHRVFDLVSPEIWPICSRCEGTGRRNSSPCRGCNGRGYVIPNFTRESP